jgi:hypothetical protein
MKKERDSSDLFPAYGYAPSSSSQVWHADDIRATVSTVILSTTSACTPNDELGCLPQSQSSLKWVEFWRRHMHGGVDRCLSPSSWLSGTYPKGMTTPLVFLFPPPTAIHSCPRNDGLLSPYCHVAEITTAHYLPHCRTSARRWIARNVCSQKHPILNWLSNCFKRCKVGKKVKGTRALQGRSAGHGFSRCRQGREGLVWQGVVTHCTPPISMQPEGRGKWKREWPGSKTLEGPCPFSG